MWFFDTEKKETVWVKRGDSYFQIYKDQVRDDDLLLSCDKDRICTDGTIRFSTLAAYKGDFSEERRDRMGIIFLILFMVLIFAFSFQFFLGLMRS
jgi:hypothetical protein